MPNQKNRQNYSIYDKMSTEMLEEILRADSQLPDSEDSDTDTILYIMEVIANREKEHSTGKFTDVSTAWASFSENYLPYLENNKSLYDDEVIEENKDIKLITLDKFSPSRKKCRLMRVACITAIITVMLFTGTVTAKAFGFDLWGTVARWTRDTFGFSHTDTQEDYKVSEYDSLQGVLDNYGITIELAPKWFPEGYLFKSVDVAENPLRTTIHSVYSGKKGEISVTIISLVNSSASTYEKDGEDVITYSVDEIEHYIMRNLERTKVVWMTGDYECSITGDFSVEEAEKMIDSIYGR